MYIYMTFCYFCTTMGWKYFLTRSIALKWKKSVKNYFFSSFSQQNTITKQLKHSSKGKTHSNQPRKLLSMHHTRNVVLPRSHTIVWSHLTSFFIPINLLNQIISLRRDLHLNVYSFKRLYIWHLLFTRFKQHVYLQ